MLGVETQFDARRRAEVLDAVSGQEFDLLVVGGGINGVGVARDASMRGLRVLLLESRDLAFGTSSRSSKLIHGGLRYLEHYQFKLVFEGTNERAALRKIAPHLVRPIMFALPVYEQARHPLWLVDVGLWMYDSLSLFKVEQRHITLRSPKRMLEREPLLNPHGLTGGIIYYDCMTDDARLTLENAMSAARHGAAVLTRALVTQMEGHRGSKTPAVVHFRDALSGRMNKVQAKVVVNCTGPWTDQTRNLAGVESQVIRPTKGVHVVVPHERLPIHHAVALLAPQDGRVFFAIPWNGRTVLGTTDTDFEGDPAHIEVVRSDVRYLLAATNHHFPGVELRSADVLSAWAGLRPLVRPEGHEDASDVPREHRLYRDGRLITLAGGKLTTFRRMARETVEVAMEVGGFRCGESRTLDEPLPGAIGLPSELEGFAEEMAEASGLGEDITLRLAHVYGARASGVLAIAARDPSLKSRVCPDCNVIFAEVVHAVEQELALSVEDVLVRRTSLALTARDQAEGAARAVADLMMGLLGWDPAERDARVSEYEAHLRAIRVWRSS